MKLSSSIPVILYAVFLHYGAEALPLVRLLASRASAIPPIKALTPFK